MSKGSHTLAGCFVVPLISCLFKNGFISLPPPIQRVQTKWTKMRQIVFTFSEGSSAWKLAESSETHQGDGRLGWHTLRKKHSTHSPWTNADTVYCVLRRLEQEWDGGEGGGGPGGVFLIIVMYFMWSLSHKVHWWSRLTLCFQPPICWSWRSSCWIFVYITFNLRWGQPMTNTWPLDLKKIPQFSTVQ